MVKLAILKGRLINIFILTTGRNEICLINDKPQRIINLLCSPTQHYQPSTTDTVGVQLVNIVEHLSAKDPDFFSQELVDTKADLKEKKLEIGLTFLRSPD